MALRDRYDMVAEDDPRWVKFWAAFPRRCAKKDARKAFQEWNPTMADVDRCVAALAWQVAQPAWTKEGGAFIPYPASYIRGERFDDEPPVAVVRRDMHGHVPPCESYAACVQRCLDEARAQAGRPVLRVVNGEPV